MFDIILCLLTFIFVFLIYYLFVIRRKKYLDKYMNGKEIYYLKKVYNVKINDKNKKRIALSVAFVNSFIIAVATSILLFVKNFILQLLLGFVVVIVLILLCYHIIGKIYGRRD